MWKATYPCQPGNAEDRSAQLIARAMAAIGEVRFFHRTGRYEPLKYEGRIMESGLKGREKANARIAAD